MGDAFHVMIRSNDRLPLARNRAEGLAITNAALRIGQRHGLALFRLVDHHAHALVSAPRPSAGRFARHLECAAGYAVDSAFEPARIERIDDQRHLDNTVRYILRQHQHHGTSLDPWSEWCNLPDLLGMRPAGAHTIAPLRALAPRLTGAELRAMAGWPDIEPAARPEFLLASVSAAAGSGPPLGREPLHVALRVAANALARRLLSPPEIDALLLQSERTGRRLRARPADPDLARALALQMGLRAAMTAPKTEDAFAAAG